jgi:uncharacterized membrane protein YedE/YeeE
MQLLFALIAGGLFGAGVFTSGMTDTTKVQGWLEVFGNWDPTLAFVMGGAMLPMALAWIVACKRNSSVLGTHLPPKPATTIDGKLALGSVMFGMGWGLAGLCPGPVIASLSYGGSSLWIFLAAMLIGMLIAPQLRQRLDRTVPAE